MSATKWVVLDCDAPNCTSDPYHGDAAPEPETVAAVRERAHGDGWRRAGGKDLCPACVTRDSLRAAFRAAGKRTFPKCATYPTAFCVCRGALQPPDKSTCTRRRIVAANEGRTGGEDK